MIVNNSNMSMLDSIIKINDVIYLPISDMSIVYNIKIDYIENTNRVIIDKLNKGMIRAIATEDTDIKFRPRRLSKNIGTLRKGETVNCFYTTSRGWRQIRTSNGTIGYIKSNKLGDEYIVRQDMQEKSEAIKIQKTDYDSKVFEISDDTGTRSVSLKNMFNITRNDIEVSEKTDDDESNNKIWVSITNSLLERQTNQILQDYKLRTNIIDLIVKEAIENNIDGISIDFSGVEDKESMIRFVTEIAPKLREIGISTCIVLNENIEKQDYINIVDYVVE